MSDALKKFGRYVLLDHIAQGGMAEICRARMATPDAAGRIIIIKRIQQGFGHNAEFLQMFKSETKLMMGLNHPNIVQVYDFGEENGQSYIAMEFVDGKNLRQILGRSNELAQPLAIELAAYVAGEAASGLNYAHTFKDKIIGQPYNIVHRDISPQNILISYDGNVKIIDFGIAKTTVSSESTKVGVIKGKPSYLSPEQISGETLDGRCDIFALGIVLWELLAGKKLFVGDNDLAILKLIESCQTFVKPPSTVNPKVPKQLDYIVLKALAKSREKRFQTAEDFQRAIHKFLHSYAPDLHTSDLAYYVKNLFKDEMVNDRKIIQSLNEKVEKLIELQAYDPPAIKTRKSGGFGPDGEATSVTTLGKKSTGARDIFTTALTKSVEIKMDKGKFRAPSPLPPPQQQRQVVAVKKQVSSKPGGGIAGIVIIAAVLAGVVIAGPWIGFDMNIFSKPVEKPAIVPAPTEKREPSRMPGAKMVMLRLNVTPGGQTPKMLLNGNPVDPANPVVEVNLDTPLELLVQKNGYKSFTSQFVLDSRQVGSAKEWLKDVQLEPLTFGFLSIKSTPSADAIIMIEGKPWVKKTPMENEKLPIGTYNIRLVNELLGMEKTITVSIEEDRAVNIDTRLEVSR
ncbi:MAG: serine/threonine-protein kinase [Bdellovibrionota bacterium]